MQDSTPIRLSSFVEDGRYADVLPLLLEAVKQNPDAFNYYNLGLVYLGINEFGLAENCYREALKQSPRIQGYFVDVGVALWVQEKFEEAVLFWRQAMRATYVDAGGGIIPPALLLYAALRTANDPLKEEAISMLAQRAQAMRGWDEPGPKNWPGPISAYLTSKLTTETWESILSPYTGTLFERYLCQKLFYTGVKAQLLNNTATFYQAMQACSTQQKAYLEVELYLARWEVKQQLLAQIG